jgi:hypothetical protein
MDALESVDNELKDPMTGPTFFGFAGEVSGL